jgi:hypothetical protein
VVRKRAPALVVLAVLFLLGCKSGVGTTANHETAALRLACDQVNKLEPPSSPSPGVVDVHPYTTKSTNDLMHSGSPTLTKVASELVEASSGGVDSLAAQAIHRARAFCHSLIQ